mmetsp:Transcript_4373/g.6162  ORF Transcript_4373/g.6162 Transcript_4373/m.6162 type:complete len:558 (+) Transcript_4373:75-1748(+)
MGKPAAEEARQKRPRLSLLLSLATDLGSDLLGHLLGVFGSVFDLGNVFVIDEVKWLVGLERPSGDNVLLVGSRLDREGANEAVWHVDILRLVHCIDDVNVLVVHDRALELERGGKLFSDNRKVGGEDGELLDLRSVARGNVAIVAGFFECSSECLDELVVRGGFLDGLAERSGIALELVRAREFASCSLALERDESNVKLALIAYHHNVRDEWAEAFHVVLNRDRGDVLATSTNDDLLVATGDTDHASCRDTALVARVQPALLVDGFHVLLLDLSNVFLAEFRVCHVAHHDVTAAEAELALFFLSWVDRVLCTWYLGLRAVSVQLEAFDLRSRKLKADSAVLEAGLDGGAGRSARLTHAVGLVDVDAERAKVREDLASHRSGASERKLALGQTELSLDNIKELRVDTVHERGLAVASDLAVHHSLEALLLGGGRQLLLNASGLGTDRLELLCNLLPDARDAKEDGRLNGGEARTDGSCLEVIWASEAKANPSLLVCGDHDRSNDVKEHTCYVGKWQVRKNALLLWGSTNSGKREHSVRLKDDVVVADHDSLWATGGS